MSRSISFSLTDKTGRQFPFSLYEEFLLFMRTEQDFWDDAQKRLDPEHSPQVTIANNIRTALSALETWQESAAEKDDATFQREFTQQIQNLVNQARSNWLWSGHEYVSSFLRCHEQYGRDAAHAFLGYVSSKSPTNLNSIAALQGTFAAYEYEREIGATGSWAEGQRDSFETLRKQIMADRASLSKDIETFKDSLARWHEEIDLDWKSRVRRSRKVLGGQIKRRRAQLDELASTRSSNFDQLEDTYQEQLRLKKPAKYWEETASKYRREGGLFAFLLILSLVLGVCVFFDFYTKWLLGQAMDVSLSTFHGIAIISAGIALYAFLVKQLSKLTFSAYHLMRDAQEREQLSYFYLSLINEGAIDEESRSIVLQALFSRTESGLLAAESGPTMPGVAVDALRVAGRNRTS